MNTDDRPTRMRHVVVASASLMSVLLYLDRFCISFAEIYIQEDLGLTNVEVGWMLSAFFWTYALGQVPAGWLTDRFGSRIMLTAYVLLWSLFTGLTGGVSAFAALLALRFGFGFSQSGAYPTGSSIVSKWV
ncbi:MAG: MFS transporter, partial [Planctomycetaceae bacterium]